MSMAFLPFCLGTMVTRRCAKAKLLPQDFLHLFALREFVDQLVEIADLAHQRLLDLFDPHAADNALDQFPRRIEFRRLGEEGLEVGLLFDMRIERSLRVARQPADDLVDLGLGPVLLLCLGDVVRIDAGETHGINAVLGHGVKLGDRVRWGNQELRPALLRRATNHRCTLHSGAGMYVIS